MHASSSRRKVRPDILIVAGLSFALGMALLVYTAGVSAHTSKLNDFYKEALPSFTALAHGHLHAFFQLGPAYVGSLVLRAPFALVPFAFNGSSRAIYVASAVPCVLALAALCAWMSAQPRRNGEISWATRLTPVVCVIINPIIIITLLGGHPEDLLGGVLCIFAVVLARQGRVGWSSLLISLAVINKPWALVGVPVVLATLPAVRVRAGLMIAGMVGIVMLPITLLQHGGASAGTLGGSVSSSVGTIFNPPQLFWFFGKHSWLAGHARVLIVLAATAAAAAWWLRGRRRGGALGNPLLLLTLVLLLRAALDPWNNLYYHGPFLLGLIAYEISEGRKPLLTTAYSFGLLFIVPVTGIPHMSWDLRAAVYAAVILPTVAAICWKLYGRQPDPERQSSRPQIATLFARARSDSVSAAPSPTTN